jgi:hypothetical protein
MHSQRITTLEKHRGNVYALIYGQCTQILQEKMKQDKNWATVSVSYKLLLSASAVYTPVILADISGSGSCTPGIFLH